MKLLRFGDKGTEKPGLQLSENLRVDVSSILDDYTPNFFENGGLNKLKNLSQKEIEELPRVSPETRLGPPVKNVGKIICIGLNYEDHAREAKMKKPEEPILFFKSTTSICGPDDNLIIPKNSKKTDWEVELGIVIGKRTQYIERKQALDHIAGYVLINDYSEREFQLEHGGQWVKGKSCDSFSPIGPWLVTKDEIADPNNLNLWLKVNGEYKQNSSTSMFIFKVDEVVSYISRFMTMEAGDVISTGTPPGVGMGFDPPQFVREGDVIELGIEGLGTSTQKAVKYS
jgi:2-keto-4-pentenoate hydratase/2-oxohepta-3-ene-1,7-dioic acid hydratase in catechol pathway